MTSKQRMSILLVRWPAAARAQGWDKNDRLKRLQVCSQAIGRWVKSMNELDNSRDIDAVYAHLGMLAQNVQATIETDHPELGDARRQKFLVLKFAQAMGWPYYNKIMRDKFGHTRIDDLTLEQLAQLRDTLNARQHSKTRTAKNASLTSEETFPDQVAFDPETEAQLVNEPF